VFSGSPAGDTPGDPQLANRDGLLFPLGPGATWIAELQKTWRPFGLEGSWKFGGWYNTNRYSEISSPDLVVAIAKSGNWSLYGLIDQLLWRPAGREDGGIGGFLRAMGAPGDRNAVSFFIDAGLTWKGMIAGRDADTAGIGIGYALVGSALRDAAGEQNALSTSFPRRSGESIIEISYQAVLLPGWTLQPLVQYVARPGGGITDSTQAGPPYRRIGNEMVLGLRSVMTF
jgi:porin